jgi:hypothetical protein
MAFLWLAGCHTPGTLGTQTGTAQAPPTTSAPDVQAWLAQGFYTTWHCETAAHAARSPSPHGTNRVCSNDLASGAGPGEFPVGAASVKELIDGGKVFGYSISRRVRAGMSGATWFWFEGSESSVSTIGLGDKGTPHDVCVGCHQAAGSDQNHSGHDFVYTQVE